MKLSTSIHLEVQPSHITPHHPANQPAHIPERNMTTDPTAAVVWSEVQYTKDLIKSFIPLHHQFSLLILRDRSRVAVALRTTAIKICLQPIRRSPACCLRTALPRNFATIKIWGRRDKRAHYCNPHSSAVPLIESLDIGDSDPAHFELPSGGTSPSSWRPKMACLPPVRVPIPRTPCMSATGPGTRHAMISCYPIS